LQQLRSDIIAEEVKNEGRGRDEDPITLQVFFFLLLLLIVRDFITYDFLRFDDHYLYYHCNSEKLLAF
jgi:hypothetical protein